MNRYRVSYYHLAYGGKEIVLNDSLVAARHWQIDKSVDTLMFYDMDFAITAVFKWSLVVSFNMVEKDSG